MSERAVEGIGAMGKVAVSKLMSSCSARAEYRRCAVRVPQRRWVEVIRLRASDHTDEAFGAFDTAVWFHRKECELQRTEDAPASKARRLKLGRYTATGCQVRLLDGS